MPALRKSVVKEKILLTPGVFEVNNGPKKEIDSFSVDRLRRIAQTGQEMIDNGLKIPIPFAHYDKNKEMPRPVVVSESGEELDPCTGKPCTWDASLNAGFAKAFYTNEEGALVVVLESFGDDNDLNTPAGKLGTTVQETSIGLAQSYRDGKGRTYKDAPVHIAACIKAVEPGQDNFVLSSEETEEMVVVSMSNMKMPAKTMSTTNYRPGENQNRDLDAEDTNDDGNASATDLPTLLNLLRKLKSPIDLPKDTTEDTLVSNLVIAVNQKISDEKNCESTQPGEGDAKPKPPQKAQEKQGFTTMSNTTDTPDPNAVATPQQPSQESTILMSMLVNSQKTDFQKRIDAIVKGGVAQAWVDKHIKPLLDSVDVKTMSLADIDQTTGKVSKLAAAEALIAAMEDGQVSTMNLQGRVGYPGADPMHNFTEEGYSEGEISKETQAELQAFADSIAQ